MLNFSQIVGHEQIIEHLKTALLQDKISHAYIFSGEKDMGKKLLANIFAKALQCEKRGVEPCGICKSCLQAETNNHPDIIRVTHQKVSIGVDDIRSQVNNDIAIKPYSGFKKIYMIDEAHKMTEQAQNALLKTIEEPPSYGVIMLLTDNLNRLLPTILSRCVNLSLKPIDIKSIKNYLVKQLGISDAQGEISAHFSQGNVGRAIRYAVSEDFAEMKREVLHLLKSMDEISLDEIMEAIKRLSTHKSEILDYLDLMILWYRDVLMFKITNNPNLLIYKDEYKYMNKQASQGSYEGIENIIQGIEKAKTRLNANVNFELTIELMLLTLKENEHD